jgi:hypothetical protein
LATLNTINLNGKAYKKYLQDKLTAWFKLFPEERVASRARHGSGAAENLDGERDEGGMMERRGVSCMMSLSLIEMLFPEQCSRT